MLFHCIGLYLLLSLWALVGELCLRAPIRAYNIYNMLNRVNQVLAQSFSIQRKMFVYDSGIRNKAGDSGIRATIFGSTGLVGKPVASLLGSIGSSVVLPFSSKVERFWEHPKQLKNVGETHKTWLQWDADYRDDRFIDRMISNSNVVINLLGPRKQAKRREEFEFINIEVPERIAKACKRKGIQRLIHFSAAAADPNSPSLDFQTKAEGEKLVRQAFPEATIFRPCTIFGQNDHFLTVIERQARFFFYKFALVYDDCLTMKQPIQDSDVALAVLNALKIDDSIGQTYELGGPHQLNMLEIHELLFNTIKHKPELAYVNPELAKFISRPLYNTEFWGEEVIKKKTIPEVVTGKYNTIQDLHIEPVTLKAALNKIFWEFVFEPRLTTEEKDN